MTITSYYMWTQNSQYSNCWWDFVLQDYLLRLVFFCLYSYGSLSSRKKDSGVKLLMFLRQFDYSTIRQVFSHFGELRLAWSHGGDISSETSYIQIAEHGKKFHGKVWWAVRTGGAIWWDVHLADRLSLLLMKSIILFASWVFKRVDHCHCENRNHATNACKLCRKVTKDLHNIAISDTQPTTA